MNKLEYKNMNKERNITEYVLIYSTTSSRVRIVMRLQK